LVSFVERVTLRLQQLLYRVVSKRQHARNVGARLKETQLVDTDPTAINLRLSKVQMSVIWPGLNFIVLAFLTRVKTGTCEFEYPFRVHPLPRGFDAGTWRPAMMDRIRELWIRLRHKATTGGRVQMNAIDIRAAILAARINLQLLRRGAKDARHQDSKTKRIRGLDRRAIKKKKQQTQPAINSLERNLKRATRSFLKVASHYEFEKMSKEWQSHLRWMRFHLAYFKPVPVRRNVRIAYQDVIDRLVTIAEEAIRYRGFETPDPRELRQAMRLFARYSRRGRIRIFHLHYILEHSQFRATQGFLFEFVEKRINLQEAANS